MPIDKQAKNHQGKSHENLEKRIPLEELQVREYSAAFLGLAGLLGFAFWGKVSVGISPIGMFLTQVKAPWIFGGIQELLIYTSAWFAGILFPLLSLALLIGLPLWGRVIKLRWVNLGIFLLLGIWLLLTGIYLWS